MSERDRLAQRGDWQKVEVIPEDDEAFKVSVNLCMTPSQMELVKEYRDSNFEKNVPELFRELVIGEVINPLLEDGQSVDLRQYIPIRRRKEVVSERFTVRISISQSKILDTYKRTYLRPSISQLFRQIVVEGYVRRKLGKGSKSRRIG